MLFIFFTFTLSCTVQKNNIGGNTYYSNENKFRVYNFFGFQEGVKYVQYFRNDTIGYRIISDLIKLNEYSYLTENETFESVLVDSDLNKIELTEEQKEKIKTLLINDTIKFSKDFKTLDYNGSVYKK